jgi:hypothetical protein
MCVNTALKHPGLILYGYVTVMNRRNGYGIREAVVLREMKIIQGIYFCIKCNPIGILEQKMKKADQLNQENH